MYSLRKSRHLLKEGCSWYKKQSHILTPSDLQYFENLLEGLDRAVLEKNQEKANELALQVESFCRAHFKKSIGLYLWELCVAIVIALIIATIVRQTWFELYEIPSGSMRPTFKELDRLTVTKTAFALNIPLKTEHFYFDPNLVQRTSVVIWSGDKIPHLDSDDSFMYIFPYTKRFVKRCMGKPGDTLYFYGGKIYGFDKDGKDLLELRDNPWTAKLEHVPFTNFEGRPEVKNPKTAPEVIFNLFNHPIGRYRFTPTSIKGEIFNGKEWVMDNPQAEKKNHTQIETYSDLFGIRNYASARILTKAELEQLTDFRPQNIGEALLYLELRHTPSLSYPTPILSDRSGITLKGYTTVIPLEQRHLQNLMKNMYTCRFAIENGKAIPYRSGHSMLQNTSPSFEGIEDGSYEFYYGKAYKILFGGLTLELPSDHPLYSLSPENVQKLYNLGIDMTTLVEPSQRNSVFFPSRYVYFREGALYALGGILMDSTDPVLLAFNQREKKSEDTATQKSPYVAFKDYGPPLTASGELDKAFISTFGLKLKDKEYLMLGDNHAMSKDSRYFGPVPEANLQGAPSLIIWPFGERWGFPNQRPYPLLTLPREIVWGIAASIACVWFVIHRRKLKKPLFKKK